MVKILGIFQGDSFFPQLFVLSMAFLSMKRRTVNARYERKKKEYKLNQFLFIDDFKLFFKNEEEIDTFAIIVNDFSTDIGREFQENLLKGVAAAKTINIEDTVTSGEFKKQKVQEHEQN